MFTHHAKDLIFDVPKGSPDFQTDLIGKMGLISDSIQVVKLEGRQDESNPGTYSPRTEYSLRRNNNKGGDLSDQFDKPPRELTTRRCFTMRPIESEAVVEIIGSGGKSSQVTLTPLFTDVSKPTDNKGGGDLDPVINWDYVCARGGRGSKADQQKTYVIKHVSGGPVHLYKIDELTKYRY